MNFVELEWRGAESLLMSSKEVGDWETGKLMMLGAASERCRFGAK